ncbi:MAG: homoserine dehydrogenase [Deltaproteobacteria bacterium]|jgi:homoserine dehydrogenase|nr:homoserine dehydrogenase [Deltaproteobacteria bacterium]
MQTNVGLLGYGNIGSGVAKIILSDGELLAQKLGWPIQLVKAAVRNPKAARGFEPVEGLLTTNPHEIVGNPNIDIVVELMGGLEPARTLILEALAANQHVITANKYLLAVHGREIFAAAAKANKAVMFEAAVAGAIPVIRALKESLSANRIQSVYGILNGTTNHILTRMSKNLIPFKDALKEAQEAGYAEADPSSDILGYDAAHKLTLLTALAYGALPKIEDIYIEGITELEPMDFSFAAEFGYVIKLLAVSSLCQDEGKLEVRLHPTMIPLGRLISGVSGVTNAVMICGHASGDIFFSGAGAGMMPTASSVVGDILEVARLDKTLPNLRTPALGWQNLNNLYKVKPMGELFLRYYIRLTVEDRPGVLAAISGVFGEHDISLAQVIQNGHGPTTSWVTLVILTHKAQEANVQAAIAATKALNVVSDAKAIRLEDLN